MIRYNWQSLKKHSNKDIKKILLYLYNVNKADKDTLQEFLLANEWARKTLKESTGRTGLSFMFNLDALISNYMNATPDEMYVYLDLLSKRDLFTYLNTKRKVNYLPVWKVLDIYDINKLKTNRLLHITDREIYFVYEGEEDG